MTMSAAIGSAEEAVRQGAFPLAPGQTFEDVSGMIALSYGLTYIWGTVGIILICKYLPRWWGIDAKAAAKKYEEANGVPNVDDAGLTGFRPLSVRAYRLTNDTVTGWTVKQFVQKYPQYKVLNVLRPAPAVRMPLPDSSPAFSFAAEPELAAVGGAGVTTRLHETAPAGMRRERTRLPDTTYEKLGARDEITLRQGDVITLGGRLPRRPRRTWGSSAPRSPTRARSPCRSTRPSSSSPTRKWKARRSASSAPPSSWARSRCTTSSAAACRSRSACTSSCSAST